MMIAADLTLASVGVVALVKPGIGCCDSDPPDEKGSEVDVYLFAPRHRLTDALQKA